MLSNEEFQELLAAIDTLDAEGVRIMYETFNAFLKEQAQRIAHHHRYKEHVQKLEKALHHADTQQLERLKEKLGIE